MRARIASAATRIATVASRQYGVISRAQLLECGLSHATITRWADQGHLHRLHRGVYAVGHRSVSREGRWLAATLGAPGSVASHGMAARLHYLDRSKDVGTLEISVPFGRSPKPRGIRVHRPRSLFRRDVTTRRGIPTTTPTRTVFDQASHLRPRALRELFEQAEYLEELDRPRLHRLLDGATGRRGLGELRRLAKYEPLPLSLTRSKLERFLVRRYSEADLEDPEAVASEIVEILRERAPRPTSSSTSSP